MEEIRAFKTSDGTVFDNKDDADTHEEALNDELEVNAFLDSTEELNKKGQRTRAKNIIQLFLKHLRRSPVTDEKDAA